MTLDYTDGNDFIICPYCGEAFKPDQLEDDYLYEDGYYEYECEECGKRFEITSYTYVSHRWKTERLEEE